MRNRCGLETTEDIVFQHFPVILNLTMIINDWTNQAEQIRLRLTQLRDSL
ncbi:MAG: hypothetical protein LBT46_15140 [Planctomycetaceae bacterium]|nr:hypothetical protein [Planctomycetaceae bacterium]